MRTNDFDMTLNYKRRKYKVKTFSPLWWIVNSINAAALATTGFAWVFTLLWLID